MYPVGPGQCDNGLIMWLPVLGTVTPDTNGLMVARQSHDHHMTYINNGSWDQHQGSLSGHIELLRFWRQLGDTSDTWSPTLQLGDVLVMNKVNFIMGSLCYLMFKCEVLCPLCHWSQLWS